MSKFRVLVFGIFCFLAIGISILCFFIPRLVLPRSQPPEYILRDNGGKLALYLPGESTPVKTYDIYTRLLPENDLLALQSGVEVFDDTQLEVLLEDYGL